MTYLPPQSQYSFFDAGLPNLTGGIVGAPHGIGQEMFGECSIGTMIESGVFKGQYSRQWPVSEYEPVYGPRYQKYGEDDPIAGLSLSGFTFDASLYNSIFSESISMVQPSTTTVNYFIRAK